MSTSNTRLIEAVSDPKHVGAICPQATARLLGLTVTSLVPVLRVHRNTVFNNPRSPRVQEGLADVLAVLVAAVSLCGSEAQAVLWFKRFPIRDFGGATPMELVSQGKARVVVGYIDSLQAGALG